MAGAHNGTTVKIETILNMKHEHDAISFLLLSFCIGFYRISMQNRQTQLDQVKNVWQRKREKKWKKNLILSAMEKLINSIRFGGATIASQRQ